MNKLVEDMREEKKRQIKEMLPGKIGDLAAEFFHKMGDLTTEMLTEVTLEGGSLGVCMLYTKALGGLNSMLVAKLAEDLHSQEEGDVIISEENQEEKDV